MPQLLFYLAFVLISLVFVFGYMEIKKNPPLGKFYEPIMYEIPNKNKSTCHTPKTSTGGRTKFLTIV